jgi:hypothetical protein
MPHLTPSGKRSKAWADFEKQIAEAYKKIFPQAKRLTRGNDFSESKPDVEVPELPEMQLDMKYRVGGWKHHSVFKTEIEDRYVKNDKTKYAVMHTKSGREKTSYVTVKLEVWLDLLKRAYVDKQPRRAKKKKVGWSCPRCEKPVVKDQHKVLQLNVYKCSSCNLSFASEDNSDG